MPMSWYKQKKEKKEEPTSYDTIFCVAAHFSWHARWCSAASQVCVRSDIPMTYRNAPRRKSDVIGISDLWKKFFFGQLDTLTMIYELCFKPISPSYNTPCVTPPCINYKSKVSNAATAGVLTPRKKKYITCLGSEQLESLRACVLSAEAKPRLKSSWILSEKNRQVQGWVLRRTPYCKYCYFLAFQNNVNFNPVRKQILH
ncbi:unnamed protein product [Trichogramma brassicae]|uniref:Uncharacterized protein n=1 Tax=Trichogramma brassicae TaxID=86971 RepID=A0A6H5INW4_9HYME|nr:unnamed protein product [Trichogramma brassicae]